MKSEKIHIGFLSVLAVVVAFVLFCFSTMGGDVDLFLFHLYLNKIHLAHEWGIPYFTPAVCGGFTLAADAQNLLFTPFQALSLLFRDQYLAMRFGTALFTLIFIGGFYRWLKWFGVEKKTSRLAAAVIVGCSGYWVAHLKAGHINFHSIALLPWIMAFGEEISDQAVATLKRGFRWALGWTLVVTPFLFFMFNSGHLWAQLVIPLFVGRVVLGLFSRQRRGTLTAVGILAASAFLALGLSMHRMGGIYAFPLTNFPREISIMGVFGGWRHTFLAVFQALFDPRIVMERIPERHLGDWWEWSAYLGVSSLALVGLGISRMAMDRRRILSSIALLGLFVAVVLQLALFRGQMFAQLLRDVFPIFKGISFYFRGVIVLVFAAGVMIAHGFDRIRSRSWAMVACVLIAGDLLFVYARGGHLRGPEERFSSNSYSIPASIDRIGHGGLAETGSGAGMFRCNNPPLVGYGSEYHLTQVRDGSVSASFQEGYLNLNDVRQIFSTRGKDGYFRSHPWPLWPGSDRIALDRFSSFHQIGPLPKVLVAARSLGVTAWILFITLIGVFFMQRRKTRL